MEKNLTTGSVFKNTVLFSLPFLLSYFLQTLYGMADLFIVGQFDGTASITAVAIGSQIMHMITVMIVGLAMGSTVAIGRAVGEGRHDKAAGAAFRRENGIAEDAFVVLFAGKLDESKGGMLLAELMSRRLDTPREVVYLIIGNATGEYGERVEARMAESPYRVLRFPTQKYSQLARFYQAADAGLIAKQASLNFFDMEACGVPVLSEDNNLNAARSGEGNGWLFAPDDVDDFAAKLTEIIELPSEELEKASRNAVEFVAKYYDYSKKADEYMAIIEDVYKRGKNKE